MSTAVISRAIFTCPGRAGSVFRLDPFPPPCCEAAPVLSLPFLYSSPFPLLTPLSFLPFPSRSAKFSFSRFCPICRWQPCCKFLPTVHYSLYFICIHINENLALTCKTIKIRYIAVCSKNHDRQR